MSHSKGNWTLGKTGGTVVTDSNEGFPANTGHSGKEAVDYYGGNLIAESILRIEDAKLIAAAPKLLEALTVLIPFASEWINDNHPAMQKAKSAIKKATE